MPIRIPILLTTALLANGCQPPSREAPKAAATPAPTSPPRPVAAATTAPPDASRPASVATLAGVWRVTAVDPATPGIVGSLLDVAPEQLAWTYRASPDFPADDLCEGPMIGPIAAPAADPTLRPRFVAALTRLAPEATLTGAPHGIDCTNGLWGPGKIGTAHLYPLDRDRMLMSWYGDTVLLLERKPMRPAAPPTELPLHADDYTP